MVEQYVLPMVGQHDELRVLSHKLVASFYHIFVLFHNEPSVNDRINRSRSGSFSLFPDPLSPRLSKTSSRDPAVRSPSGRQRSPAISLGGPVGGTGAGSSATARTPPGLPVPLTIPYPHSQTSANGNGTAIFLLPLQDWRSYATQAFRTANDLAEQLLPGSHPVRLSVKVEYVAYVYDCLHEAETSRKMARLAIRHVYEAQEGMDDDSFEDAAEMVGILGKMMKRGLGGGGSSGSQKAMSPQAADHDPGKAARGAGFNKPEDVVVGFVGAPASASPTVAGGARPMPGSGRSGGGSSRGPTGARSPLPLRGPTTTWV